MALHVRLVKQSDGEELPVPVGETQIGRGPFLKVSHSEVDLELTERKNFLVGVSC